jgi:hypothetical protein
MPKLLEVVAYIAIRNKYISAAWKSGISKEILPRYLKVCGRRFVYACIRC